MTTDEKIDRLTAIVESLAASVVAHDNQIEALIAVGEKHQSRLDQLTQSVASLERQWQAYINTLPNH